MPYSELTQASEDFQRLLRGSWEHAVTQELSDYQLVSSPNSQQPRKGWSFRPTMATHPHCCRGTNAGTPIFLSRIRENVYLRCEHGSVKSVSHLLLAAHGDAGQACLCYISGYAAAQLSSAQPRLPFKYSVLLSMPSLYEPVTEG